MTKYERAVVFDLDDTLYPYKQYKFSGFNAIAESVLKRKAVDKTTIRQHLCQLTEQYGLLYDAAFDDLAESYGWDDEFVDTLISVYRNHDPEISLSDETEKVLRTLAENKIAIGIHTEGAHEMQRRKIDALDLKQFIDSYIITPDKSNSDSLSTLLSDLEAAPEKSWYVGDNPNKDFFVPLTFGMTTVRIRSGIHKDVTGGTADRQIDTFGEIVKFLTDD